MTRIGPFEKRRKGYFVSTNTRLLDTNAIHALLRQSYWAKRRPLGVVRKSMRHSLCFGLYRSNSGGRSARRQVGLARVITDYATFAYLCDVFIEPTERGRGLGKWLMGCVMSHPELRRLRHFCLTTRDTHELYKQFGFAAISKPWKWMEIVRTPRQARRNNSGRLQKERTINTWLKHSRPRDRRLGSDSASSSRAAFPGLS
ncbi:MAG: GNAT family N-acetyltransferase [Elusimicrobia bacterium]|nr:GNAT family N-acetyltransferase [Elusimicrobiota bacterium]